MTNIIGLDYSLTMRDSTGQRVTLNINADSIRELVKTGMSLSQATEEVEGNAFANAIARKEINDDAWLL
jgi:selenocysteine-specific translation elongation factor